MVLVDLLEQWDCLHKLHPLYELAILHASLDYYFRLLLVDVE